MYVTDLALREALIFNSAGRFSKSFGEFNAPVGICLDKDGPVYISDRGKLSDPLPIESYGSVLALI